MTLIESDNGLRKVIKGSTLAFELGANLGISFIDQHAQQMKTFQLSNDEVQLLISFLRKNSVA